MATKNIFAVLVCIMLFSCPLFAQQEKGDSEIQLAGTFFTTVGQDFKTSAGFIQAKYGRFITDHFEIGVAPSLTINKTRGQDTDVTVGLGAFLQYAFLAGNGTTVPYFGGQYFKRDLGKGDDSGSAGVNGGVKFFLTEKAALDFSGNYLFDLNSESQGGFLLIIGGISFLF